MGRRIGATGCGGRAVSHLELRWSVLMGSYFGVLHITFSSRLLLLNMLEPRDAKLPENDAQWRAVHGKNVGISWYSCHMQGPQLQLQSLSGD